MKERLVLLGLIFMTSLIVLHAQSMTDNQITSYAKQRKSAGADNKVIVQELLAKGATKDQLKRLATQASTSGVTATGTTENVDFTRSRENNEEKIEFTDDDFEQTRQIFGHDIFRSKLLSFEPNMSLAISPTYVLGAGDEMIIDVYGASASSQKIKIAPDGTVTIPKIGPVGVSGLTVDQAQARVRAAMGGHYQNASIKVTVGQTRTISINVMGEVKTPGTYTLSAFATVFHALYMAGGINELGTLRDVKVARNGRIISTVDVYEYILSGRLAGNVKLRDNDVIIVGSYENLVKINGKVKRPMWYEMKKNESLNSLIRFCGGFTGDAYKKNITINRKAGDKWSVYTVGEFDFNSFKLADEDSINIPANEKRFENMVCVSGAVKRPGMYGLKASQTVRGLVNIAGGLEERAITNRAVIVRMNEDRTRRTLGVDLKGILESAVPDVALQNEDSLVIASRDSITDDRKLTILGEVWTPGDLNYSENTTIEDLIIMAGGLKESASLLNVEVSRRIYDPSASTDSITKSQTFTFHLNPDLTVEGEKDFRLEPYDKVFIHRSPVYEEQSTVNVSGEIVFAGYYGLKNKQTRLSDLIKKAGGLKKNAVAANARLMRVMTNDEIARVKQLQLMKKNSSDSLKIDNIQVNDRYSVAINLGKALANPGGPEDIFLCKGDSIIIPTIINTVKISGEVLYPNSVTYVKGKSGSYYINEAGGFTTRSRRSHAYIVYGNGHVSKLSSGKIEPGCEIVVPVKEKKDNANDVMKWVSIGSTLVTLAAVVTNLLK